MILKTFAYHSPSKHGLEKISELRRAFSVVHTAIASAAPDCREKSIAFTELETAAMWAVKAVVYNDPESLINTEES